MKKKIFKKSINLILLLLVTVCSYAFVMKDAVCDTALSGNYTTDDGKFTVSIESGSASITGYKGSDANLTIPATIAVSNNNYPVIEIGQSAFKRNSVITNIIVSENINKIETTSFEYASNLKTISFPSTINYYGLDVLTGCDNLETINVNGNNFIFSDNGVLFSRPRAGRKVLLTYPSAKTGTDYTIPNDTTVITTNAIGTTKYLKNIYIPSSVTEMYYYAIGFMNAPINIYYNTSDISTYGSNSVWSLPSGSNVYVKTDTLKAQYESSKIMGSCGDGNKNVTVISLESSPSNKVPAKSLKFTDDTDTKTLFLTEGNPVSYSYILSPSNTTDMVTWSSSDTTIAKVDRITGKISSASPFKSGKCTVTGSDESNHSITVDVTAYRAVTAMDLSIVQDWTEYDPSIGGDNWASDVVNPTTYKRELDSFGAGTTQKIYTTINPGETVAAGTIAWESNDPSVIAIEKGDTVQRHDGARTYTICYATMTYLKPGSATIKANVMDNGTSYEKSVSITTKQKPAPINMNQCTIPDIPQQNYTGFTISPTVTITYNGQTLVENKDYNTYFLNNTASGTATVQYQGKGNYTGSVTKTFAIVGGGTTPPSGGNSSIPDSNTPGNTNGGTASNTEKITNVSNSYNKYFGDKPFTLKAKGKGKITYASSDRKVATIDRSKGKVAIKGTGSSVITIKSSDASRKVILTVAPKKNAIGKLSAGKKSFKISYKKDTKATGYQISYSTAKNFKGAKTTTIKGNKNTSRTIQKLKSKKTYFVRVRAYKTAKVNGKNTQLYSKWSSVKKIKVR